MFLTITGGGKDRLNPCYGTYLAGVCSVNIDIDFDFLPSASGEKKGKKENKAYLNSEIKLGIIKKGEGWT